MPEPLILHEYALSGNCYKVRLTAAILGVPIERREYDIMAEETRTATFLKMNPNGRIPVLQIGERFLPESNAACFYLAEGTPLVPEGRFEKADMLRWLLWEQYNHEPNVATLRFWHGWIGEASWNHIQRTLHPVKVEAGEAALRLMDEQLAKRDWLVGEAISLADIVLYAYTHVAEGGGFRLGDTPNVQRWLKRIETTPGYVPMSA